ncbi:MAG: GNAT family N-acetyltransferase [Rhizomicrobium sp.]
MNTVLRNAGPADWPAILALNEEFVHFLSPMDEVRLAVLATASCYFRIIEVDGAVAAFLMAFRKGATYDGAIFRHFESWAGDFLYIDRIVVDGRYRRHGLADRLYDDLENFAHTEGIGRLLCEVNIVPPNETSLGFHERRGFGEIGQLDRSSKVVSLREHLLR